MASSDERMTLIKAQESQQLCDCGKDHYHQAQSEMAALSHSITMASNPPLNEGQINDIYTNRPARADLKKWHRSRNATRIRRIMLRINDGTLPNLALGAYIDKMKILDDFYQRPALPVDGDPLYVNVAYFGVVAYLATFATTTTELKPHATNIWDTLRLCSLGPHTPWSPELAELYFVKNLKRNTRDIVALGPVYDVIKQLAEKDYAPWSIGYWRRRDFCDAVLKCPALLQHTMHVVRGPGYLEYAGLVTDTSAPPERIEHITKKTAVPTTDDVCFEDMDKAWAANQTGGSKLDAAVKKEFEECTAKAKVKAKPGSKSAANHAAVDSEVTTNTLQAHRGMETKAGNGKSKAVIRGIAAATCKEVAAQASKPTSGASGKDIVHQMKGTSGSSNAHAMAHSTIDELFEAKGEFDDGEACCEYCLMREQLRAYKARRRA